MATTPTLTPTDETETETSSAPVFGVDRDGGVHRWDDIRSAVVITDAHGRVEETHTDVSLTEISGDGRTWENFVDDEGPGWIDFWFDDSIAPFGRVTAALEEVDQ